MFTKILLSALTFFWFILPAHANEGSHIDLKKWVDENGQVHYGDSIPTRYLRQEHQIINQEGVILEEVPAAKTEAELLEERRQAKLEKIRAEKKRQQDFKDRVLIDTYTTERDLMKAREERLGTFNSLIDLTGTIIKSNEEQLERLLKRKTEFEKFGKELPIHMAEQERILRQQIIDNNRYVEDQKKERQKIVDQFDRDLARYLYLKKQEELKQLERQRRILERRQQEERLYQLPPSAE